jgi:dTDP-L-rhamnose 4-epimerase
VAAANVAALAATAERHGLRAYNIASGVPISVGEIAGAFAAALGGPAPVVTGEFRVGDVRHVLASPARACAELDFVARIGPAEGIAGFAAESLRAATA